MVKKRLKWVELTTLRPNNWYVNETKLQRVREAWRKGERASLPPVLVTEIDGEPSLIDGHARAYAALERGETQIKALLCELESIGGGTQPQGSTALYRHIHRTGPQIGVTSIADLGDRILGPKEHKKRWVGYCDRWIKENEPC